MNDKVAQWLLGVLKKKRNPFRLCRFWQCRRINSYDFKSAEVFIICKTYFCRGFFGVFFHQVATFSSCFISAASSRAAPPVPRTLRFLEEGSILSHQKFFVWQITLGALKRDVNSTVIQLTSTCIRRMFSVDVSSSASLPLFLSHCYCIDHNNVSGDTPFHGHSSETELHKPFTTRSP